VSAADLAREAGLERLGRRPALATYAASLWRHRQLTVQLARSRFRAQNEQNRLGVGWVVLRPLLNALVYGVVFGLLLRSDTRPDNFVPFLVVGLFAFQHFASCLTEGAKAITGNLGLVRTLHFPRALLPVAAVLQQVLALGPMMAAACAIALAFGEPLTLRWFLLLPALLLLVLFNTGVAFVAARATLHIRDIAQLIPFVVRFLLYTSGVFFSVQLVDLPAAVRVVAELNPVQVYLTLVRTGLLAEVEASWQTWALGAGWAVVTLVAGALFFWRAEEQYGRA